MSELSASALPSLDPSPRMNLVMWLVCVIAAIGFAFDTYELLMLPLILRPAVMELSGGTIKPGSPEFAHWLSLLFYVPAICGGVFGLLGGYLTDWLGRRRVLSWSIALYAVSAFLAGYSTSLPILLVLRCTTFVGVCVEFVAATAWLAELFPEPKRREHVLGWTQAFASVGGFMVAFANHYLNDHSASFPAISKAILGGVIGNDHAAWRYTLMSGLVPAIPLILIRPFLPESPVWKQKRLEGTLRRPGFGELFSPALARTTIITTIMVALGYAAAFGAIQQIQQITPGLPEVKAKTDEAEKKTAQAIALVKTDKTKTSEQKQPAIQKLAIAGKQEVASINQAYASDVTKKQEIGGLVGRVILAILATLIVSRRWLLRVFQIPGIVVMPLVFGYCAVKGLDLLYVGMFVAGMLTVGQFSFWGNYLPRVYPLHLRGTGESFAANIGGRMIGTSFAWVTTTLAAAAFWGQGLSATTKWAYAAAIVGTVVYVLGFLFSFALPEPGLSKTVEE